MIKVHKYRQWTPNNEKGAKANISPYYVYLLIPYLVLNKKLLRHCLAIYGSICESEGCKVGWLERMYAESKDPKE